MHNVDCSSHGIQPLFAAQIKLPCHGSVFLSTPSGEGVQLGGGSQRQQGNLGSFGEEGSLKLPTPVGPPSLKHSLILRWLNIPFAVPV